MSRRATDSLRGPAPSFGFLTETEIETEARARRDDKRQFSARSDSFREIETVIKFTFDFGAAGLSYFLAPRGLTGPENPLKLCPTMVSLSALGYFLSKLNKALQL